MITPIFSSRLFSLMLLAAISIVNRYTDILDNTYSVNNINNDYGDHDTFTVSTLLPVGGSEHPSNDTLLPAFYYPHEPSSKPVAPLVAVFYNVYLAEDDEKAARDVVDEQISLVGSAMGIIGNNVTLYVVTIGKAGVIDDTKFLKRRCSKYKGLTCRLVKHHDSGFEEVTLQTLYEFCTQEQHSHYRVAYMHNKGSLNDFNGTSSRWRRNLMHGMLHPDCIHPPGSSGCDVCSLNFYPTWGPVFPGNFFTARCDYVEKLHPPIRFGSLIQEAQKEILHRDGRKESNFLFNYYLLWAFMVGIKRFATELWIGSHPSLQPCDLGEQSDHFWRFYDEHYKDVRYQNPYRRRRFDMRWSMAPRFTLPETFNILMETPPMMHHILTTKSVRIREYFFLAGHILRWLRLYQMVPHPNSWAWYYFPDGEEWQRALRDHNGAESAVFATVAVAAAGRE